MKKFIFVAIIIFGLSNVCFAQLLKGSPKPTGAYGKTAANKPAPVPSIEVAGKVTSVSSTRIVITDKMGKAESLAIGPSTLLLGKDGKPTTLEKITKDENVRAKYRENQGMKSALAIQVLG
jgi:hypothetical protein